METREYAYPTGIHEWRDTQGWLHRDDGPALIAPGLELYYDYGQPLTVTEHEERLRALAFRPKATPRERLAELAE